MPRPREDQPALPMGVPPMAERRPRRINAVVSIPIKEGVKPMSYRPDADLHTKLLLYSMAQGISMQKIIDEALRGFLSAKGG